MAESLQSCRQHQGSHPQLLGGFGYLEVEIGGTCLGHTWDILDQDLGMYGCVGTGQTPALAAFRDGQPPLLGSLVNA